MASDRLTKLPSELLLNVLHFLDPLALLHLRTVHPRIKACVDQLPDYQAYQLQLQEFKKQHHESGYGRKRGKWSLERAAELFAHVREGGDVDYHFFFQVLLRYPQARAFYNVLSGPE